jgi:hypothetical protein
VKLAAGDEVDVTERQSSPEIEEVSNSLDSGVLTAEELTLDRKMPDLVFWGDDTDEVFCAISSSVVGRGANSSAEILMDPALPGLAKRREDGIGRLRLRPESVWQVSCSPLSWRRFRSV